MVTTLHHREFIFRKVVYPLEKFCVSLGKNLCILGKFERKICVNNEAKAKARNKVYNIKIIY